MPRRFIRRTKSAFDSRTQEWRDVGLGSEIDRGDARHGLGGMVVAIALIVGVLVLFSERKRLFPGHGVEVRVAVAVAVSAGRRRFRRIVIVTDSDPPAAPCGACRQVLAEFGSDLVVESVGPRQTLHWNLRELLPSAFGPEQLPSR